MEEGVPEAGEVLPRGQVRQLRAAVAAEAGAPDGEGEQQVRAGEAGADGQHQGRPPDRPAQGADPREERRRGRREPGGPRADEDGDPPDVRELAGAQHQDRGHQGGRAAERGEDGAHQGEGEDAAGGDRGDAEAAGEVGRGHTGAEKEDKPAEAQKEQGEEQELKAAEQSGLAAVPHPHLRLRDDVR